MRKLAIANMDASRTCGECIVCCVYPRITELNKPRLTHCKNLNLLEPIQKDQVQYSSSINNCKVYGNRPLTCSGYSCFWLLGYGDEDDRPDKSGILVDKINSIENAIECRQVWPDSANTFEGKETIKRMAKLSGEAAIVIDFYEEKIIRVVTENK